MSLITNMTAIAQLLGTMEQVVLEDKIQLANMELQAIDPESKSAVDKQVMIFAQKTPSYNELKTKVDRRTQQLSAYQRMYSLYSQICQRIDFNIDQNPTFVEFESQVAKTVSEMSGPF